MSQTADLFMDAVTQFTGAAAPRVLDFGCGEGALVEALCKRGADAYGCDLGGGFEGAETEWRRGLPAEQWTTKDRLSAIQPAPYRLPYPDGHFDAVVSTSVMEHAQNKEEVFAEIARVLKPEGVAIHLFPSRWYLPTEPHIGVPLASWLWPHVPRWWLGLWAALGVRNPYQRSMSFGQVTRLNADYVKAGLHYLSRRQYVAMAEQLALECDWQSGFYLQRAAGGAGRLYRTLRIIPADLVSMFREQFLVVRARR